MRNISELRNELLDNFTNLKTGKLGVQEANAMTNTSGKILASVNTELKYAQLNGKPPKIKFLEE
jgi:hypothetical protein